MRCSGLPGITDRTRNISAVRMEMLSHVGQTNISEQIAQIVFHRSASPYTSFHGADPQDLNDLYLWHVLPKYQYGVMFSSV